MSKPAGEDRLADVAVVAIGRNEGERLRRCLRSVVGLVSTVIYVDSGSTDGSPELAKSQGARVILLESSVPFTAARGRNAGADTLDDPHSAIGFIQFVDGDCEVEDGWLTAARNFLAETPEVAGVFGRRRERYLHASIYNALCDEEWNVPPGDVKSCGGDVMFRAAAFKAVGGYRAAMIAGEEPELCVRLRQRGWKLVCLPRPMTIHDAAITCFSQWWRRAVRSGHAYAEGAHLHGAPPERHWVRETRRIWLWGLCIPVAALAATAAFGAIGLGVLLVYVAQIARLYYKRRGKSMIPFLSSVLLVLGNFPEAIGQIRFHANRIRGRMEHVIEYK